MLRVLKSIKLSINKNSLIATFVFVVILCLVLNPYKYLNTCYNAIIIFGKNILPALFPFMFFSKILTSTGYVEKLSKHLNKLTSTLYRVPAISGYIFLMSIISGYPLGAKITADIYEKGLISREEAHRVCSFTSNSGPMFIVGTVGTAMLANSKIGYILLFSHILGSLINGFIYRNYVPKNNFFENKQAKESIKTKETISDFMQNSIISCLMVGGYIVIFFVLTEVISSVGIINPLVYLLQKIGVQADVSKGTIFGVFEITNGCNILSTCNCSVLLKATLCSFVISFGGLAVAFQGFNFLNKFNISKKFYFAQKLTHATLSAIITFLICIIFGI